MVCEIVGAVTKSADAAKARIRPQIARSAKTALFALDVVNRAPSFTDGIEYPNRKTAPPCDSFKFCFEVYRAMKNITQLNTITEPMKSEKQ